jgi:cyclophilin family peptidyl-prolyl cis-trans isomerase
MYGARAAGVLGSSAVLVALGADPHDNVREAALAGLIEGQRPEAVAVALDALRRPDYQLVLTATRAFTDPSDAPRAAPALTDALARITKDRRDTSRDPRIAILERLQALGDRSRAAALEVYLADFDPRVAAKAAEILQAWTGTPRTPAPQPLPRPAVTLAAVQDLRSQRLRVTMAGRGAFDIALDVDFAPLTALRIARRAGDGYYDGLTFHRVAANFVIQGGSPGANEYAGDALYMRDEVGVHRRGTVGISTRGRDTGDAQIFVNLVDSPRLDHQYTVFGTVVSGLDVVDGVLEGDVIERVEIVGR